MDQLSRIIIFYNFRFPVESMVLELTAYNGSVLSQINANHLLDSGSAITDTVMYVHSLGGCDKH